MDTDIDLGGYVFKDGLPFLHDNPPGAGNLALGRDALVSLTPFVPSAESGTNNSAFGSYALQSTTSGYDNVAFGAYALAGNTTGARNVAVGGRALYLNTYGDFNAAVGSRALYSNVGGSSNTALGEAALFSSTSGSRNTAVGASTLVFANGDRNVALGHDALFSLTTGDDNTALGSDALEDLTVGYGNIAIGRSAGSTTSGSNNILIGNIGEGVESNAIRIGADQSATYIAGIFGESTSGGSQVFVDGSNKLGTIASSRRFKEDIEPMADASKGLHRLRPVTFRYVDETVGDGARRLQFGLIAEEVAEVEPDLVVYDRNGEPYSVRYHLLTPMLVNELQRLRSEVEQLQARLARLEGQSASTSASASITGSRPPKKSADDSSTGMDTGM